MPANRAAPSVGYDTEAKQAYREDVWRLFRRHARRSLASCRVLIMPSVEGIEIEVAERFGVLRSNIVAVDWSAAIAATVSREYPGITAWGCDAFDAPARAAREGLRPFDCVHFDLTSNLSPTVLDGLSRASEFLPPGTVVCVNTLKGREMPDWIESPTDLEVREFNRAVLGWSGLDTRPVVRPDRRVRAATANLRELYGKLDADLSAFAGDCPHSVRRTLAIWKATGWRLLGSKRAIAMGIAGAKSYRSGKVPMQWSVWRTVTPVSNK